MENFARKFLKERLQKDKITLYGFEKERDIIKDLFLKTAKENESNSALLIGNGGKTTLVNSVLFELLHDETFVANTILISLSGLLHIDDRAALKSATTQMNLDKQVEGRTFNSFSENLTFLLSCLRTGQNCQRLIFIIEEFDLFCAHHNQTLLYNLFDVAQSAQTPICVLGMTCRLDVVELLEKRVKSRFSHRQIFLLAESDDFDGFLELTRELLVLPEGDNTKKLEKLPDKVLRQVNLPFLRRIFDPKSTSFQKKFTIAWNSDIEQLLDDEKVIRSLEQFYYTNVSIAALKLFLFQLVTALGPSHDRILAEDVVKLVDHVMNNANKVRLMVGLSVLEICLLISIKHHCDIYDNDPFNFEMILTRFNKFAIKSSTMQGIDRETILRRFEHLKYQEFITPIGVEGKVQKEYQMYKMCLMAEQIDKAVQKYQNLPTEVEQWAKSSLI